MGSKKKWKLLDKARNSPFGWCRKDLDNLYKNFGFIIESGTNHDVVKHPDLSKEVRATLTRSSGALHPDYIRHAVKLIDLFVERSKGKLDE